MLVFEIGVAFIWVGLKVVLPFVDPGCFVQCSLVLLGRKQGVNNCLALGCSSG